MTKLTKNQCIELSVELERALVRKMIDEVRVLNGLHERTDAFASGYSLALEEFEFRINEIWNSKC